jgi:hypothetical protein
MKSFKSFIFESAYDSFAEKIATEVLLLIKKAKGRRVLHELSYEESVSFELSLEIIKVKNFSPDKIEHFKQLPWETINFERKGFVVDANTLWDTGDDDDIPMIELVVIVSPDSEPSCYAALKAKLADTIRHEIEHTLQKGFNRTPGHEITGRARNRQQSQSDYRYFLLPEEVMPMIAGMRLSAIDKGITIDEEFEDYLYAFVESSFMTPDQMKIVIKKWLDLVIKHFPKTNIGTKYQNR